MKTSKEFKDGLSICNVSKSYGSGPDSTPAVANCTFHVPKGSICMVVGPSGCGKTTLLNAIAGFHNIDEGAIYLDSTTLCRGGGPPANVGPDRIVVFQNGALFPWKTILENVAFGPVAQSVMSFKEASTKAEELLREAGLERVRDHYPAATSSGVRRRVEIVRALINTPSVLLLDEPYRALDTLTKVRMHEALLALHARHNVTIFFITHDLQEAIFLGSKVVIMSSRPCTPRLILDIDLPYPRDYSLLASPRFQELLDLTNDAIQKEALMAFEQGEREG